MKQLSRAAWAVAAYIAFCGVIHLPYMFLTRAGVVEQGVEMSRLIAIMAGPVICISEVLFFAYMFTKIASARSQRAAVLTLLTVPAVSAMERVGNFVAGLGDSRFAEMWSVCGDAMNNISTLFSVVAIVALCWLAMCLRRGSMAQIMSFVAAYDTLFTLVVWSVLAPTMTLPVWLYPLALIQYYIVWVLFYVAFARYYRISTR